MSRRTSVQQCSERGAVFALQLLRRHRVQPVASNLSRNLAAYDILVQRFLCCLGDPLPPPYAHCTNDEVAMPGIWDGISPPSPYRPAPPLPPNAASCTARRPRHCHSLAPLEYSPHSFLTPPSPSLSSFASMLINTANLYNLSYVNVAKQSFVVISRRKS